MKQIIFVLLTLVLVIGVVSTVSITEAATYRYNVSIKFYGNVNCIVQKTDEAYFRISDGVINDQITGHLIVKGERENLGPYLLNLASNDKPLVVKFSGTFDPKKIKDGNLREYIELYWNDAEIFDQYKRPWTKFDPTRTTYSWSHGVNLGC